MTTHVPVVRPSWPTAPPAGSPGSPGAPVNQGWVGYSYPPAAGPRVASTTRLGHRHLLSGLLGGLAGVVVLLIVIALIARTGPPVACSGLTCSIRPPTGPPVETGTVYTVSKFGFTARVSESFAGFLPKVSTANDALTLSYSQDGTFLGVLQLTGEADNGSETAEQIVESEINRIANGAQLAYVIPGSMIGYQPGFGAAYNFEANTGDGESTEDRVIVLAAVHDGLAIVSVAAGPLVQFGEGKNQFNDGHVSIADSIVALTGDPVLNSVLWPGQTFP